MRRWQRSSIPILPPRSVKGRAALLAALGALLAGAVLAAMGLLVLGGLFAGKYRAIFLATVLLAREESETDN